MAEKTLNNIRIVNKHDTEANWLKATGFTPKQGELIVYDVDSAHSYERIKIGDGVQNVNDLPFVDDTLRYYVDDSIAAIPTPDVSGQIETHNASETAHSDIRNAIGNLSVLVGDTSVSDQIYEALLNNQADWNQNDSTSPSYVVNRTHWTNVVKTTITFDTSNGAMYINDGESTVEIAFSNNRMVNTEAGMYYRILDDALTNEQFKSLVIKYTDGDFIFANYWDTFITEGFITDRYGFAELAINVLSDNTTTIVGEFSTKGLYLSTSVLNDKLIEINYIVDNIIHTLDLQYIPDSVKNLVVTITNTGDDTFIADKTPEEIIEAFESGVKCYIVCYDNIGLISNAGKDWRGNNSIFSVIHTGANSTVSVFYSGNKWNVRDISYLTTDGASISGTLSVNSGNLIINTKNGKSGIVSYDGDSFQIGGSKNVILLSSTENSTKYFNVAVDDDKNIIVTNTNDATDTLTISNQTVDMELSNTSINPVQNKVINEAITNLNALVGDVSISEQISEAFENNKSDWNQNDVTKANYIQNRPFYSEDPIETAVLSSATFDFNSGDAYFGDFSVSIETELLQAIEPGIEYIVNFDGTEYRRTAFIDGFRVVIGNAAFIAGTDTGEPFAIDTHGGTLADIRVDHDNRTVHTISITAIKVNVHKIDMKYIPDCLMPKSTYVELVESEWIDDGSLLYQIVEIGGVTPNSKLDLQPTAYQILDLQNNDIAFVLENDDSVVTAYCLGGRPNKSYTMQVLITEVIPV